MRTTEPYNPISIEHRVRSKLENKASGVTLPDIAPTASPSSTFIHEKRAMNNSKQLKDEFMNLLCASQAETEREVKPGCEELKKCAETDGTNKLFLTLNKQESTKSEGDKTKESFSFVIQNSDLGELKLKGSWINGHLKVLIQPEKKLEVRERKLLCAMLTTRLSNELGVPLEVSFD